MTTYPCPFCGAPADLDAGCSGCGRPPYPDAAEVVRLGGRANELLGGVETARVQFEEARSRYGVAVQRLNAVRAQRNMLAARVRQTVADARPAAPPPIQPTRPQETRPQVAQPQERQEASPRAVQNVLFILGGLLLGSAAVVFAAVAWASFGVLGRAAILAAVTLITLAVPPVALARGLRATAETFAALGLLLVVLDGYAAWYVNLAGLADATTPGTFAGLVGAVTAAVAGGYAVATGLRGPRFAALLALQPTLPLLATDAGFGAAGWALVFVALVAADVLLARTVEKAAWVGAGLATPVAAVLGLVALATVDDLAGAARAGSALLLLAAVIVVTGLQQRVTAHVGVGVAAGIVALVAVRVAVELVPDQRYIAFAAIPVLLALAAVVLPERVRTGGWVGALVVAGLTAVPFAAAALYSAGIAVDRALPAWHGAPATMTRLFDWQVPAGLALVGFAFGVLVRHRTVAYPAAILVAFAAPGIAATPLRLVSILDVVLLVAIAAAALLLDRWAAVALPVVAAHLVLVGLDTPAATLLTGAGLVALCAAVTVRAGTAALGRAAAVVGLTAVPLTAAAAVRVASSGTARLLAVPVPLVGALAGLVLATALVLVLRSRLGAAGVLGIALAGAAVTVAAVGLSIVDGGRLPFGVPAAIALLCTWFAWSGAGLQWTAPAVLPALVTLVAVLPAAGEALFRPYGWLSAIWQGAPDGTGLDPSVYWWEGRPDAFDRGPAAVTLGLLAVLAVLIARRTGTSVWAAAGTPATLGTVLACLAFDAPWPSVPAVTLAGGLITALIAGLGGPSRTGRRVNVGAFTCWFTGGAGLAGCLATPAATLCALGAVLLVAAVIGVAGRSVPARFGGWLVGSATAGWLAFAAARAADLPLRSAGYWVLLAAALVLATALVIRRRSAAPAPAPAAVSSTLANASADALANAEAERDALANVEAEPGALANVKAERGVLANVEAERDALANVTIGAGPRHAPAPRVRAGEALLLEVVAHATAVVALLLTTGDLAAMAGISSLWGIVLGLRVLAAGPRVAFAAAAAAAQLVAYWLVLASEDVALLEAYTVPAAALALGVGWFAGRRREGLGSWTAYGPGLLAGFAPSLASVLVVEGDPARRLLLGAAAVAVVIAGAAGRLQAPVVVGGSVLAVLALHEIIVFWDLLPRWAPLAVAGLVLVLVATTYERRLRDMRRLRSTVGRMR